MGGNKFDAQTSLSPVHGPRINRKSSLLGFMKESEAGSLLGRPPKNVQQRNHGLRSVVPGSVQSVSRLRVTSDIHIISV
jgi:hypothetical protein